MNKDFLPETHEVALHAFKPARHCALIGRWLRRPHVVRWWGPQEEFLLTLDRRSADSHAMIAIEGRPVGYLCWNRLSREELEAAHLADLPGHLVDIDIMIGELDCLGRGIGPTALGLLMKRLKSEGVGLAGLATSVSNRSAIRAFEKAGFRFFSEFEGRDGRYRYLLARTDGTVELPVG